MQTVIPNEILSALVADKCRANDSYMQQMQAGGAGTPGDMSEIDVNTVQNTASMVHIVLPYYSDQEGMAVQSRKMLNDEEMAQIAGGEIGFGIAAALAGIATVVSGLTVAAVVTGAVVVTGVALAVGLTDNEISRYIKAGGTIRPPDDL